jgi:hypothetical protein
MLSSLGHQGSIVTAVSHLSGAQEAARDFRHQLEGVDCALLLVFFSSDRDPVAMASAVSEAFPGIPVAGCSTAGELHAGTMLEGSITLMAFRGGDFRIVADLVEDIHQLTLHRAYETGRQLRGRFAESRRETPARGKSFAIMLVDGLSNREELVVTAARCAIGEIPLIGGSAGDAQLFHEATLIFNGHVVRDAAILLLVETELPFQTFRIQNFEPTPRRFVVTAADTERRVVHELNAAPAAEEYARAIGLHARDLSPAHFAAYPFIVRAGNDYFCRAIRQVLDDGSISFFCAIDEGMVLSLAHQQDMVSVTRAALEDIDSAVGGIDRVLGFDCLWRKVEIDNRQMRTDMELVYRHFHISGFNTYGEQFNGIHLNQTLTGLALGRRRDDAAG